MQQSPWYKFPQNAFCFSPVLELQDFGTPIFYSSSPASFSPFSIPDKSKPTTPSSGLYQFESLDECDWVLSQSPLRDAQERVDSCQKF